MKKQFLLFILSMLIGLFSVTYAQKVGPSTIKQAVYHDVIGPIKDLSTVLIPRERHERDGGLKERYYPFSETALPIGNDPVWQKENGNEGTNKAPDLIFDGQNSPYYPSDCNGHVGPNHFMQAVNCSYAIYNKAGTLLAGPTDFNTLFAGVTGAGYNDGDPIILYDGQADRWLAAEFSISGANDYMLIAVSQTGDPTGTWDRWSFDVDDMPDYMKFGVWRDGYYMSTNTNYGDDVYVFDRDEMLAGGASPTMIGFDNPYRPNSGFHCIMPLDNDGTFAPNGTPGQFITINDDAWGGGSDALWIYELDADWATPGNSTFARTQIVTAAAFDSEFNAWGVGDIDQPGTSQLLDGIPMILMYRAQYRNWGTSQSVVCCHTVDVDATNHAGVRWYELENTGSGWSVRQQGTYAPDAHSRWMGSIAMNSNHEIALGYSISSSTEYPGIRYCGQSSSANSSATGTLDIAEDIIYTGSNYQSSYTRWGDYSQMSIDPSDDVTFWYTDEYINSGKKTKIAKFEFSGSPNDLPPPENLVATVTNGNDVGLSWDAPTPPSYGDPEWFSYTTMDDFTNLNWPTPERASFFDNANFSYSYPAEITVISHGFYEHSSYPWPDATFRFKIYDTNGSALLYESGDIEAVHLAEIEHTLTTPLEVTGNFYVAVVPVDASGHPSSLSENVGTGNTHSYNGSAGSWALYDDGSDAFEYMTRVYLADQDKEYLISNTYNNENNINVAKGTIDNNCIAKIYEEDKGKYFVKKTGSKATHSGYKVYRNGGVITTIADPGTTTYDDNDLAANNYNYYVTATYTSPIGESDGSNIENVTIQPPPVGGTATATSNAVCSGSNTTITLANSTGSIQWQESANGSTGWADVTGGSGATTSSYTTADLTVENYYRAVLSETGYPDEYSNTVHITVIEAVPEQPSAISGETAPCEGTSETYNVTNVSGVTYAWDLPAGWTGSSTTNSIDVTVGSSSGTISVTPSNECGVGTARTLDVTVSVSVQDLAEYGISIYPNPSNGSFNIVFENSVKDAFYRIRDMTGKVIHEEKLIESENIINLSSIPKGMYFIELNFDNQSVVSKIVIE